MHIRKNHQDGISGFTPHVIMWKSNTPDTDGKIKVLTCCGMHHCGVVIQDLKSGNETLMIDFILGKELLLTEAELGSLIAFKNTGYEII